MCSSEKRRSSAPRGEAVAGVHARKVQLGVVAHGQGDMQIRGAGRQQEFVAHPSPAVRDSSRSLSTVRAKQ